MTALALPAIIQGGMGIGVSNWCLANAVSARGHLGVVSGTVIDSLFIRRLQDGDPGGHLRRAMAHFPIPGVAEEALKKWFKPEGRAEGEAYGMLPMYRHHVAIAKERLTALAAFVEVWLAREGHDGPVGINLLTKVQLPNLAILYGAMLAKVDVVLMGAGIPKEIPGVLDAFAEQRPGSIRLDVDGMPPAEAPLLTLDPIEMNNGVEIGALPRPTFLAIIASNSLATMLTRKASGKVDGFIIEGPTAGGHNAPPRGAMQLDANGEPIYGERDVVNLDQMVELGLPFWLAGGEGSPEALVRARAAGAQGIQVGTLFAYTEESGIDPALKRSVLASALKREVSIRTDPLASPTGYPFKLVEWSGDPTKTGPVRKRVCDLGYLRTAYAKENGRVDFRCAAEPIDTYVAKGGEEADTTGRKCLCNALLADVGHAQVREEGLEPAVLTSGDDLERIHHFLNGRTHYTAADVLDYLMSGVAAQAA
jgi:NAD(P)H-dependent flavin oxidoreductase YrpB (nitropropane dioxygenase family)